MGKHSKGRKKKAATLATGFVVTYFHLSVVFILLFWGTGWGFRGSLGFGVPSSSGDLNLSVNNTLSQMEPSQQKMEFQLGNLRQASV